MLIANSINKQAPIAHDVAYGAPANDIPAKYKRIDAETYEFAYIDTTAKATRREIVQQLICVDGRVKIKRAFLRPLPAAAA